MSDWIRIDCDIGDSPKVGRMAAALRVHVATVVGCVTLVFARVRQVRGISGNVSDVPDLSLEQWALWQGKRGVFAAAFRREFCTTEGVITGWDERQRPLIERLERDRERKRVQAAARNVGGDSAEVPRSFRGGSTEVPSLQHSTSTELADGLLARGEDDDIVGTATGDITAAAVQFTSAVNRGVQITHGEQIHIIRHDLQFDAAEQILAAGVDPMWAMDWLHQRAKRSKAGRIPRSLEYYRAAVVEAWHEHQASAASAQHALAFVPGADPTPPPRRPTGAGARESVVEDARISGSQTARRVQAMLFGTRAPAPAVEAEYEILPPLERPA